MLSRIKVFLREGRLLILKDLDRIYGALYDMLNQNYSVVGGKQHCRIALGAHNNPMCEVHQDFKCIVFMDQEQLDKVDPPFLNRFEKQYLDLDFLIRGTLQSAVHNVTAWVEEISSQKLLGGHPGGVEFGAEDMFAGFNGTSLKSLVLRCHRDMEESGEAIDDATLMATCKKHLLQVAFLDGVVRAKWSLLADRDPGDVDAWCAEYFLVRPLGLISLLSRELDLSGADTDTCQSMSRRLIIMSEMSIHPDTLASLATLIPTKSHRLQTLTSEKSISDILEAFFADGSPDARLLLFEASDRHDKRTIHLLRFLADQHITKHASMDRQGYFPRRHICIVVHMHRFHGRRGSSRCHHLNFLSTWDQFLVGNPQGEEEGSAERLMSDGILDVFRSGTISLMEVVKRVLFRSYLHLKYRPGFDAINHIQEMSTRMKDTPLLLECLCNKIEGVLGSMDLDESWQKVVACSRAKMSNCGGVLKAAEHFVEDKVNNVVAKILYALEMSSEIKSYFGMDEAMQLAWRDLFLEDSVLSVSNIPDPQGLEYFRLDGQVAFRIPFVQRIIDAIQIQQDAVCCSWNLQDEASRAQACDRLLDRLSTSLHPDLMGYLMLHSSVYVEDFMTSIAAAESPGHVDAFKWIFTHLLRALGSSMEGRAGTYEYAILAHFFQWNKSKEMCALARLVDLYPTCKAHMEREVDDKESGISINQSVRLVLESLKAKLRGLASLDDVREWSSGCRAVSGYLWTLSEHMGGKEIIELQNFAVVEEFLRVITEPNAQGVDLEEVISLLIRHHSQHVETDYRSVGGIGQLVELMETVLEQNLGPLMDNSFHQIFSNHLSDCAASVDAKVHDAVLGYILQNPVPPHSLSVMVALLEALGDSSATDYTLAHELLRIIRVEEMDGIGLGTILRCVNQHAYNSQAVALFADSLQVKAFRKCEDWLAFGETDMSEIQGAFQKALLVVAHPNRHAPAMVAIGIAMLRDVLEFVPVLLQRSMDGAGASSSGAPGNRGGVLGRMMSQLCRLVASAKDETRMIAAHSKGLERQPEKIRTALGAVSDGLMHSTCGNLQAAQVYLLKVIRHTGVSFAELEKIAATLSKVPLCMGPLTWSCLESSGKICFNPMKHIPGFESARTGILDLMHLPIEEDRLQDLFDGAAGGAGDRKAMIAAVVAVLYFPRCCRKLNDEEKALEKWMIKKHDTFQRWPPLDRKLLLTFANNGFPRGRLLMRSDLSAEHVQRIVTEASAVVTLVAGQTVSPLSLGWNTSDASAQSFIPAMPSDERAMIGNALIAAGSTVTHYQCGNCSYIFIVGNCGALSETGRCPECGATIGGGARNNRMSIPRQTSAMTEAGIVGYVPPSDNDTATTAMRTLTPFAYRLAKFWMHTTMRWSSELEITKAEDLQTRYKLTSAQLANQQDKDWTLVQELLPAEFRGDRAALLLNALVYHFALCEETAGLHPTHLATVDMRQRWEDLFVQQVVRNQLDNPQAVIAAYQAHIGLNQHGGVEAQIDETDTEPSTRYLYPIWFQHTKSTIQTLAHSANEQGLLHYLSTGVFQDCCVPEDLHL